MRKGLLLLIPLMLVAASCRTGVVMWSACTPGTDPTGTDQGYAMVCQGGRWKPIMSAAEFVALQNGKDVTIGPLPLDRPDPEIFSASWGTDDAVSCPRGDQGLDNIPVTFNEFIRPSSINPQDFQIVRSDNSVVGPECALQFPPDESNEAQTVNLIGDFGDSVNGPTPVSIRIVGTLEWAPPGSNSWTNLPALPAIEVDPIAGGPYIVDAWTIMPALYAGDANRCTLGNTFVRVMWSNGLTEYPTGNEVGDAVVDSYRAVYDVQGMPAVPVAPLDVADLDDHSTSANADNMHDLCLPTPPRGGVLTGITIDAGLIQDPNGDPNDAQSFRIAAN